MVEVTDPVELERALAESERRFREVFETNTAPKLVIDPSSGAIVDANQAAVTFYGYPKDVLTRMSIQEINTMPPDQVAEEMARTQREERLYHSFQHRVASGQVRDVDVYSGPVSVGGRRLLHSIVIDQTERRELERRLLRAQRMETIGVLAGGIAHNFNNALAVIVGCAELARPLLSTGHPASDLLAEITAAAARASEVTRQLLALGRKQALEPRWISVDGVVRGITGLLRRLIGADIEMTTALASSLAVRIDPGQLEQLIANLVINARDAMPGGGKLHIRTEDQVGSAGLFVRLSVSDTGSGIPPELFEQIFQPFFTTKGGRGSGLGLATCQAIAEAASGRIVVESAVGQGARFSVILPASTRSVESLQRSEPLPTTGGSELILVVDDERSLLSLAMTSLSARGYRVVTARDGHEALERAAALDIDLLVTDVVMPRLRGDQLALKLRESNPDLPVLLVSGNPEGIDLSDEPAAGFAFLAKPYSPDDLARKVRAMLDERATAKA